jgi:hypothetical protein
MWRLAVVLATALALHMEPVGGPMTTTHTTPTQTTTQPGWAGQTALPVTGRATYYVPGLMERVYKTRRQLGQVEPCPECVGMIAMLRVRDVGRRVWIAVDGAVLGKFLVVDCASPADYERLVARGLVAEFSYEWAQRLGMKGPLTVTVLEDQ